MSFLWFFDINLLTYFLLFELFVLGVPSIFIGIVSFMVMFQREFFGELPFVPILNSFSWFFGIIVFLSVIIDSGYIYGLFDIRFYWNYGDYGWIKTLLGYPQFIIITLMSMIYPLVIIYKNGEGDFI